MTWRFASDRAERALCARDAFLHALHDENPKVDGFTAGLIFTELVANVMRHASGPIEISLDADEDGLWLHVADRGPPFELRPSIPAMYAQSGRGLLLVSQYAADVSLERTREGNVMHVKLNPSISSCAAIEPRNGVSFKDEHALQSKDEECPR